MRTNLLINTFTAGQLCEWMEGRTDTAAYTKGARLLKNCMTRPFGGVFKRPGTLYINETKTTGTTRLLPFAFSVSDTYIIEVGVGYFRFYKDGAIIETAPDTPYEVVNTLTADDVTNLKFTQSNDVLFLAIGSDSPKTLSRISDTNWTYEDLDFQDGPFLLENTSTTTITPSATTGTITLTASDPIFESGHVGSFWSINVKKLVDDVLVQGVVQITGFTSTTVVDAVVTKELKDATATTIWAEGAWSDVQGYPKAVAFSNSRLWFANTENQPQTVWGSEVFVYNNFDKEESVEIELPSNKFNEIRSLVNGRDLAAFTAGGNFIVNSGSNREAITTENITSYQQSNIGSSGVQAVRIGDFIYYPQRAGEKLMEFKYSWEVEGYQTAEVSMLNEDVLVSGIKEMSIQETEDNVLYQVLENGDMATLTRVIAQDVSALSPHETDGDFISVASVPNDAQFWDDTYVIVQREIDGSTKQYIELFTKPRKTDLQTGIFCDSASVYNGNQTIQLDIVGTTATAGSAVFTSDMVGEFIEVNNLDLEITSFTSSTVVEVDYSGTDIDSTEWAISKTTIDDLDYLEGKTVQILRDGAVEEEQTVSGGEITLTKPGYDIIIGLGYTAEVETMPIAVQTQSFGTSQGQLKRPVKGVLKVIDTMWIEIEGGSFDEDVFERRWNLEMGKPNPLYTGDVTVNFTNDSNLNSTIKIKQELPLPMNLLSLAVKVEIEED